MRISQFFEEDSGQLSAVRLYSFIALLVAAVLTFQGGGFDMILTWLTAAFAPKLIQKIVEDRFDTKDK